MRKITAGAAHALLTGRSFKLSNTEVIRFEFKTRMYLHGNLIAEYYWYTNELFVRDSGWRTNVTKERINGAIAMYNEDSPTVSQRDWEWYLGERKFSELEGANGWVAVPHE